jgi:predicted GNAT family acetyltransferase
VSPALPELQLTNDSGAHRYRLLLDGQELGFVEYDPIGELAILIKHTEVKPEFEGKGYGSELVRRTLEDVRQQGKTVLPICPYAMNFIRRHREYIELVRPDMRAAI